MCRDLIPFFLVFRSNVVVLVGAVYGRILGDSFLGNGVHKLVGFSFVMLEDDRKVGPEDDVKSSELAFQSPVIGHFTAF